VERSITGNLAASHLEYLFLVHGAPRVLRPDQDPQFGAKVFQRLRSSWRGKNEPVPPYDYGHVESFRGSLRAELLNAEIFYTLGKARIKAAPWVDWYNRCDAPKSETLFMRGLV
jgi:putative transposase